LIWRKVQISIAGAKNRLECGTETTSFPVTESTREGCTAWNPGAAALCGGGAIPMTKRRLKKTANEIARDGFERFTGWAHQIFKH
jgi:hypothetical protein